MEITMKYINYFLFFTLLVFSSCSEDAAEFDCTGARADLESSPFIAQLTEYMGAAFMGDTTYVQPSDWGTNCNAYQAGMQELFDEGCFTDQDSVTQADIDSYTEWCNL